MTVSFTPSRDLFPFESRFFDSSVGRVHYIDEGEGRPIVFFHGNPMWSFLYRGIVSRLRGRFRCVAVDYPGFGLSDRPDGYGYTPAEHAAVIEELLDSLGLDGFIVMGQDWGGPIGTWIASSAPDRIAGLVLGNTWFWPVDRMATTMFSRVMSSGPMQRRILERNLFVDLIPRATARRLTSEEMDHYRAVQPTPEARVGIAELPKQLRAAAPWLTELADRVPTTLGLKPTLVVWGMRDFAFPPKSHVPRMRATFTDMRLLELPRAKHFIQEDAPEEIADAITGRFG